MNNERMNGPATMPANEGSNWKSRADSMISQLFVVEGAIDGAAAAARRRNKDDDPGGHYFPPIPENCSTSSSSSSSDDGDGDDDDDDDDHPPRRARSWRRDCSARELPRLDDLAGRGCVVGLPGGLCAGGLAGAGGGGGPACASLLLRRARPVLGSAIRAYLSSPLWLALLPLAAGLAFGYLAGRGRRRGMGRGGGGGGGGGQGGGSATRSNDGVDDDGDDDDGDDRGSGKRSRGGTGGGGETMSSSSLRGLPSRLHRRLGLKALLAAARLDPRVFRSSSSSSSSSAPGLSRDDDERDNRTRDELRGTIDAERESGVDPADVPRHIAVIMDGNRRYGRSRYGSAARGHRDGSKTLMEFSKWCISEGVQVLTVYAFSTENWDRDPTEVSALMSMFCTYCDELRVEAVRRGIRIRVLTTEGGRIPDDVRAGVDRMVAETSRCDAFEMNICLSYGGRGEIVNACRGIADDVRSGKLDVDAVDEDELRRRMLTVHCCDPDVVIRTSGEERLSNFLLWQVAYSEFFFLKKHWPELRKDDLLEVIRAFARGRKRRYGK